MLGEGEDRLTSRCCSSGSEATGTTIPFIMQPARAMTAEIAKVASKPPIAAALPPISDPSAMPKNSDRAEAVQKGSTFGGSG